MTELSNKGTRDSCTCDACQAACEHKPGWFLPGEAEKVADHLDISLEELFRTALVVDRCATRRDTMVLSPAVVGGETGDMAFPIIGTCIFFENGRCGIHEAKPYECRQALHGEPDDSHEEVAEAWEREQQQILDLLDLAR